MNVILHLVVYLRLFFVIKFGCDVCGVGCVSGLVVRIVLTVLWRVFDLLCVLFAWAC